MWFPYLSSFQNGLTCLSTPNGCHFMTRNVRGGFAKSAKCIGNPILKKGTKKYPIFTRKIYLLPQFCFKWFKNGFVVSFWGNLSFECGDLRNFHFSPISGQSNLIFFVKIAKIAKIGPSNDKKSAKNEKFVNPHIQMKVYPKIMPQTHF